MSKLVIQTVLLIIEVFSIPVDNGVDGDPEIECGTSSIAINANTRNPFKGHVYVKLYLNIP
ncbi:unnamed protein product [Strongylus vulgaris]|uniref:Cuticlin N-terminal domain-containing protein n=1 Tax=Strongylus vulgaris TaxID=40348 RepID=A0A3P7JLL1_STRVU|nr:unnamed protein product [Strongylus vulgaris]